MSYVRMNLHNWKPLLGKYPNGRTAVIFVNPKDGEEESVATVNLPNVPLEEGEVIIKDYSENEGMYDSMLKMGYISPEIRRVETGMVDVPVVKLLIQPSPENKYTG